MFRTFKYRHLNNWNDKAWERFQGRERKGNKLSKFVIYAQPYSYICLPIFTIQVFDYCYIMIVDQLLINWNSVHYNSTACLDPSNANSTVFEYNKHLIGLIVWINLLNNIYRVKCHIVCFQADYINYYSSLFAWFIIYSLFSGTGAGDAYSSTSSQTRSTYVMGDLETKVQPLAVTLDDGTVLSGKKVMVRGFLNKTNFHQWYLIDLASTVFRK